jgi:hypothetical protein
MEKTTYSYHHFLFPFRWDLLRKGFKKNDKKEEKYTFDERTELQKAAGIIKQKSKSVQNTLMSTKLLKIYFQPIIPH